MRELNCRRSGDTEVKIFDNCNDTMLKLDLTRCTRVQGMHRWAPSNSSILLSTPNTDSPFRIHHLQ